MRMIYETPAPVIPRGGLFWSGRAIMAVGLCLLSACAIPVADPPATATWAAFTREASRQSATGRIRSDDALSALVRAHLHGQEAAQVIGFFEANGFTCTAAQCQFDQSDRQNWFEVNVGVTTLNQTGVFYRTTTIDLSGAPIRDEADLRVSRTGTFVPD